MARKHSTFGDVTTGFPAIFGLLYGTFLTFTYSIKDKRGDLPTLLPQPASSLTVIVAHENSFLGLGKA